MNVMHLNNPKLSPYPYPWNNCLLQKKSLVAKRLGTAEVENTIGCTVDSLT